MARRLMAVPGIGPLIATAIAVLALPRKTFSMPAVCQRLEEAGYFYAIRCSQMPHFGRRLHIG